MFVIKKWLHKAEETEGGEVGEKWAKARCEGMQKWEKAGSGRVAASLLAPSYLEVVTQTKLCKGSSGQRAAG